MPRKWSIFVYTIDKQVFFNNHNQYADNVLCIPNLYIVYSRTLVLFFLSSRESAIKLWIYFLLPNSTATITVSVNTLYISFNFHQTLRLMRHENASETEK